MADHSRNTTTAMVLGTALVLVLAPVARAQDRMPPIPMSDMTEAQKKSPLSSRPSAATRSEGPGCRCFGALRS